MATQIQNEKELMEQEIAEFKEYYENRNIVTIGKASTNANVTADGSLQAEKAKMEAAIEAGVDAKTADAFKAWIDGMADLQVTCRVITVRERVPLNEQKGDFNNALLETISDVWQETKPKRDLEVA